MGKSEVFNEDCMIGMARYPDKYFDLAVVDPPYGIGRSGQKEVICNNPKHNRKYFEDKGWDNNIPNSSYWDELFRVSKNQIVWGGNYFTEFLKPSKAWIFWFKGQRDLTMSDGEMAWTSFDTVTRQIEINRNRLLTEGGSVHPTQKPIKLYDWIFTKYATEGEKILDTHLGSGNSRIAAQKHGLDFVGFELDKEYFEAAEKRYKNFISQLTIQF